MKAVGECVGRFPRGRSAPRAARPPPITSTFGANGLDCVVAPREQALVGLSGHVSAGRVELWSPEEVRVRLVADDDVLDLRHEARDRRGERRELLALRIRQRRIAAELGDVDYRRDRRGDSGPRCTPQRITLHLG